MNIVVANQGAERTGESGSIPDSQYNIHCQAYGGPDFKMNYLVDSCRQRLAEETCNEFSCPWYFGRIRKVTVYVAPESCKGGRPKTIVRERPCVCCATVGIIQGRELCYECYKNHRRLGTLEDFPTSTELRRMEKQSKAKRLA